LAEDAVRCLPFEVSHDIGERIILGELSHEVNVVWHDDKTVEFEPFSQPEAVKCIEEDTLEDVTPEDVKMIHRFCGDKVEVIRIEVRLPSHYFLYKCAGFGNPLQPFAVLDCQVQVFGIWQSLRAIREFLPPDQWLHILPLRVR
jgi:hypothetical protein